MQTGDAAQICQYHEYHQRRGHSLGLLPQCIACGPNSAPRAAYVVNSGESLLLDHGSGYRKPLHYENQGCGVYLSGTAVTSASMDHVLCKRTV